MPERLPPSFAASEARFKIVVTANEDGDPTDDPRFKDDLYFDDLWEAITEGMTIASDPRDYHVWLRYDLSENEEQYIAIEHVAVVSEPENSEP